MYHVVGSENLRPNLVVIKANDIIFDTPLFLKNHLEAFDEACKSKIKNVRIFISNNKLVTSMQFLRSLALGYWTLGIRLTIGHYDIFAQLFI